MDWFCRRDWYRNVGKHSQIPREIRGWLVSDKFMLSEAASLLLDSQVPSPPQLCPWNLLLALDGRFDRVGVWP